MCTVAGGNTSRAGRSSLFRCVGAASLTPGARSLITIWLDCDRPDSSAAILLLSPQPHSTVAVAHLEKFKALLCCCYWLVHEGEMSPSEKHTWKSFSPHIKRPWLQHITLLLDRFPLVWTALSLHAVVTTIEFPHVILDISYSNWLNVVYLRWGFYSLLLSFPQALLAVFPPNWVNLLM